MVEPPPPPRRGPGIMATLIAVAGLLGQIAIALGQPAIPLIGVEGWIALLSYGPPLVALLGLLAAAVGTGALIRRASRTMLAAAGTAVGLVLLLETAAAIFASTAFSGSGTVVPLG